MNKYLMIVMKELRVIIPLSVIAVLVFAVFVMMNAEMARYGHEYIIKGDVDRFTLEDQRYSSWYLSSSIFEELSEHQIYLLCSVGTLAVLIALIQFWLPSFTGTWKFALHRPVRRSGIVISILATSMFTLFMVNGLCWTALCRYFDSISLVPVESRYYMMGWKAGIIPLICYVTMALCGLSGKKSYLSKLPLVKGVFLVGLISLGASYNEIYLMALLMLIMFVFAIVHNFVMREY